MRDEIQYRNIIFPVSNPYINFTIVSSLVLVLKFSTHNNYPPKSIHTYNRSPQHLYLFDKYLSQIIRWLMIKQRLSNERVYCYSEYEKIKHHPKWTFFESDFQIFTVYKQLIL